MMDKFSAVLVLIMDFNHSCRQLATFKCDFQILDIILTSLSSLELYFDIQKCNRLSKLSNLLGMTPFTFTDVKETIKHKFC